MSIKRLTPAPVVAHGLFSYQIGGSERVGADLAIAFKQRGYKVICFAFYDDAGPVLHELKALGIECVDLNYERFRAPWRRISYAVAFFRFLKRFQVRHLIVHHATALMLCGPATRLAGVDRLVMIEHAIHQLAERPRYRNSARRYCRYANVITGVDRTIVDYFRKEMAIPSAKLRYLPNGVRIPDRNDAIRSSVRTALGCGDDVFVVLFVGRLQPVKDVGTLIRAFAILRRLIARPVTLLIAGDGPERTNLEILARESGVSDVIQFLGARRDVGQLLMAADVFAMTSVTEGQPMALIEAMANGLPCVATSVGGIPALLEDGAGVVIPPSDPEQAAAALARVIRSPDLQGSIGFKARERIRERHSLERIVDAYLTELELPATAP